jgi:protein ImuA
MHESSRLHSVLEHPAIGRGLAAAPPESAVLRPLGHTALDRALGGGLVAGAVHEVFARGAGEGGGHDASAMGFAVMLALRLLAPSETILWLREACIQRRAALYGPGLVELGLDPARLVLGLLPDARALLRAGVDALRCAGGLGAVILELHGNPALMDLTASRRFALAAEASGVTPLLLRLGNARPAPSAARTRWAVAPAPSARLEADAPGHCALAVTLLRQRGGPAGLDWDVEWDRERRIFRAAALSGARLPLSGGGPGPRVARPGGADGERWRIAG